MRSSPIPSASASVPTCRSATYLSGGLDSSEVAALASHRLGGRCSSPWGIGFADAQFDESAEQDAIASELGVDFQRTTVNAEAIAALFPRVIELAEQPLLRTAPAPLLHLSAAVHDAGLKIVLTGEGADELFGGYDIFKEDKVRRFWAPIPRRACVRCSLPLEPVACDRPVPVGWLA